VRQNITLSLDKQTLLRAKVLAARRGTSISALVGEQIETLIERDETYERAKAQALAFLDKGFHLGGGSPVKDRAELHDR
jgi:hypothetical protein